MILVFGYIALAICALVVVGVLYLEWCFIYWKRRGVYTLPPTLPFGNAKNLFLLKTTIAEEVKRYYEHLKAKGLPYGGFYVVGLPTFVPADIGLVRNIFSKDFIHFMDHSNYSNEETDPITGHLFSLKGAKWKALRVKLTPTFTSGKLKMMFQTLVDTTREIPALIDDHIRDSTPIDIKEIFARYTTDVVGSIAFGLECSCLRNPNTEFREKGKRIFEADTVQAIKNTISLLIPQVLDFFKIAVTRKDVEAFFMKLVKDTVEFREKNNYTRKDFMQLLIGLKNQEFKVESKSIQENGKTQEIDYYQNGLSMNELAAQAFVFFAAGFETSSTAMTYLTYEICRDQEIQNKLRKEIRDVLAKHNDQITYDALSEMTYLDNCLYETLRKYPPVPILTRECTKDYNVPDTDIVIKKGTAILIPVLGIQHDPEYFPYPEKFDPDRFTEENKSKRPPYTFLAFGEGPRLCIGMRYGILQAKVGLVVMLRDYKFSLNSKTPVPLEFDPTTIILTTKGGVWVEAAKV